MVKTWTNKWAVATISLGKHHTHTLERKIAAAAAHGFSGIELCYSDLVNDAKAHDRPLKASARKVKELCDAAGIEVLTLNPLKFCEGNLASPLEERLNNAKEWIDLAAAAGTKIIQMPSTFIEPSTGKEEIIIPELRALADLAAAAGLNLAYEAVAFAKHNFLWQHSVRVVEAVDRPNFGLCLDSFHVHARIWGDAYARDGILPDGPRVLKESMQEFLTLCPKNKVLYIQLSDASKFDPPLTDDSPLFAGLETKDSRLAWSRSCRPFPFEKPGYFPLAEISRTWLVEYDWQGWVSMESFLKETESEENGPEKMAERAAKSIETLYTNLKRKSNL